MSIAFACPYCSHRLKVSDEFDGKNVRCPRCKQSVTAEADVADEEVVPPPRRGGCLSCLGCLLFQAICIGCIVALMMLAHHLTTNPPEEVPAECSGWTFYVILPSVFLGLMLSGAMIYSFKRDVDVQIAGGKWKDFEPFLKTATALRYARKKLRKDARVHALLVKFIVTGKLSPASAKDAVEMAGEPVVNLLVEKLSSTSRDKRWRAAQMLDVLGWKPPGKKLRQRFERLVNEANTARKREDVPRGEPLVDIDFHDSSRPGLRCITMTLTAVWNEPIVVQDLILTVVGYVDTGTALGHLVVDLDLLVEQSTGDSPVAFFLDDGKNAQCPLTLQPGKSIRLSVSMLDAALLTMKRLPVPDAVFTIKAGCQLASGKRLMHESAFVPHLIS